MALKNIFLLLIIATTITIPLATADITINADYSYSFENFPSSTVTDNTGNGINATVSDPFNVPTATAKIGNWGMRSTDDTQYIQNSDFGQLPANVNNSVSFWVFPEDMQVSTYYDLFSLQFSLENGNEQPRGLHARITPSGEIETYFSRSSSSGGAACSSGAYRLMITSGANIAVGEYTHVVIQTYRGEEYNVYINGEEVNNTVTGTGSINFATGTAGDRIGTTKTNCFSNTESTKYIDQFIRYSNKTLTQQDIMDLYNAGIGRDPFTTSAPTQVANIANVVLGFQTSSVRDFNDYFQDAINYSLSFDYALASYLIQNQEQANINNDFAVAINNNQISFWGFNTEVQPVTITVNACNNNGCLTQDFTLRVGFSSGAPQQIASVAPLQLGYTQSRSLRYSDFFIDYNNRFIEYVNPDNAQIVFVSEGNPNSNQCFTASINGDLVTITSKELSCQVNARLVVDDGNTGVYSNEFSISVVDVQETGSEYLNLVLGLFPPANTISFSARMLYVVLALVFTALAGIILIFVYPSNTALVPIGVTAIILMEIVFFTAIGYIPIWVIAMATVTSIIVAILFFSRAFGGS